MKQLKIRKQERGVDIAWVTLPSGIEVMVANFLDEETGLRLWLAWCPALSLVRRMVGVVGEIDMDEAVRRALNLAREIIVEDLEALKGLTP